MLLAVELFSTIFVWDSGGKEVTLSCCINGVLATEPTGWLASQGPWLLQQWLIGIINFISNYSRKWTSYIVRLISFRLNISLYEIRVLFKGLIFNLMAFYKKGTLGRTMSFRDVIFMYARNLTRGGSQALDWKSWLTRENFFVLMLVKY